YTDIIFEKEESLAVITMNRPEKLNAISPTMLQEMLEALEEAERNDEIKVTILTGAGQGFSPGADVSRIRSGEAQEIPSRAVRESPISNWGIFTQRLHETRKPVLAAVNGMCAGVALCVALGCDIRFASEQARFCSVFVRRGLLASSGGTFLLPRVVGVAKALELMWSGDIIDAHEAERIGLVSRVVPHDQLMPVTREFALRLAKGPSLSIELTKRLVYQGLEANDFLSDLKAEAWAQNICSASEDAKEGVRSFLEKRDPVFKGQ
ncbi:MAG: enoyl-CoA hydratase/isomerase family protein, partial [Dehalococcoidia bacterium]